MTFDNLVHQINELAEMQRDRGTYFEYLARAYFQNEPTYQNEFKNVWMLADVPEEFGIPKVYLGVDLVAEKFTGELVAIQEKFYNHSIQKSNKVYARGGTEQEKEAFLLDNKSLFEL